MTGNSPPSRSRFETSPRSHPSRIGGVSLSFAFIVILMLFMVSLSGWLLTSEQTGKRYLRTAVAHVTEIDLLIIEGRDELRAAAEAEPGGNVRLAGFPVLVEIPASLAARADMEEVRGYVLGQAAERLYSEGADAFRQDGSRADVGGFTSAAGLVRHTVSFISDGVHRAFLIAMIITGVPGVFLAMGIALRPTSVVAGIRSVGVAFAVAAVITASGALLLRALVNAYMNVNDEYLLALLLRIIFDALLLLFRAAAVFAVAGIALIAAMTLLRPVSTRA